MKKTFQKLLIASAVTLVACGKAPPQTKAQQAGSASTVDSSTSYALRGADHSWPGEAGEDVLLVKDNKVRNFYVIFDGSGSMEETGCGDGKQRIVAAKQSITTFFNAVPKESNVGLLVFDSMGLREVTPLKPIDVQMLSTKINQITAGSGTPLGKSLKIAYQQLSEQGRKQQGYGEYHIVVITDGAASDKAAMNDMVGSIVANSPINLHTIGFCLGSKHALNKKGIVNYRSASNVAELVNGLKDVLAEAESFDTTSFSGEKG
jgi:Ca-activated chloride channel family protein